jgi:hypothetical protein
MKNRSCPDRDGCVFYRYGECETCDTGNRILELNKKISRLKAKTKWISVDEKLPKPFSTVLVYDTHTECVRISLYRGTDEVWRSGRISHWMPFPEPPKMKGGE